MMKKLSLAAAAVSILFTGAALAADLPARTYTKAPAPMPVAVFTWTGCFVGGNAGGLWAQKGWRVAPGDPSIGVAGIAVGSPFGSQDVNSWLGGAQVGCDYQFAGNWVVGIQADYDWSNGSGRAVDLVNNAFFAATGWRDESRIQSLGSVTGRVGYAWDRFLGYVKGGYAWERDNYSIINPTNIVSASASETRGGWTVGIGGEYAFTNMISAFVEYDYYDFGTRTNRMLTPTNILFDVVDIRETKSVVKAGVNFRWGPGGAVVAKY
jgi:outer membrane immunogenic protein